MRKKTIAIIFLAIPFIISGLLWVGNYLAIKFNYNLNPVGIGNTEWFLFWGAYLGGVATFIAFLKTTEHNKNLSLESIEHSRKSLKYQAECQNIADESKFLSKLLADLEPREIYDIYDKFMALPKENTDINLSELKYVLHLILDTRKKIRNNDLLLRINSSIYSKDCEKCRHRKVCERGTESIRFIENYDIMYNDLYQALGNYYEHLSCRKNRQELFLEKNDLIKRLIENIKNQQKQEDNYTTAKSEPLFTIIKEHIDSLEQNNTLMENRRAEIEKEFEKQKESFDKTSKQVISFFTNIKDYEDKQFNNLLISIQLYISAKREVEYAKLNGKKVYEYELDPEWKESTENLIEDDKTESVGQG